MQKDTNFSNNASGFSPLCGLLLNEDITRCPLSKDWENVSPGFLSQETYIFLQVEKKIREIIGSVCILKPWQRTSKFLVFS
jgi:hypothetical protein